MVDKKAELPKIKDVVLRTIYDEEIKCKMIPLSIKATIEVETSIELLRSKLQDKRNSKISNSISAIESEGKSLEELSDSYLEAKITNELSKLGEEITEKRVNSQKEKRREKLLEGKTRKDIINELAGIIVDTNDRKDLLFETIVNTLYYTLRKIENLREYIFESPIDVMESLDQDALVSLFEKSDENKTTDEEIKN